MTPWTAWNEPSKRVGAISSKRLYMNYHQRPLDGTKKTNRHRKQPTLESGFSLKK